MFKLIRTPLGTTRAPIITAILVATVAGGSALLLPSIPDVNAGPQATAAAVSQARPKADRLPILAKGAACSLGSPNDAQARQFDMRSPAGEMRTVRIALR
jgi:hypothetical protein